jgi:cystathionine beta-lyase/cystathionine gamma-synthase
MHPETDVLHRGEGAAKAARPLNTPIYATSTFTFENVAALEAYHRGDGGYLYSRHANPTIEAAEAKLAVLEGAEAAMLTSSGMAATATALAGLLAAGDELVCSSALYGGTLQLVTTFLRRFGVDVRILPPDRFAAAGQLVGPKTRVVWFETPANPTLRCVDIREVAEACRAGGALSVLDNTFATPVNQQPLALGIDLVMHSATKYLNGHGDVTAGVLAASRALLARLQPARRFFGGVLDPAAAYQVARGLKTLALRVARHNQNAGELARWLEADTRVSRVFYPGLPSHPDHETARRQMRGFGGMICFEVPGGLDAAGRLFDRLGLIQRAASLGGTESLCSLPVLTSHHGVSEAGLAEAGVTAGMIRLSVGLEHPDDLVADLDQALG